MTFIAGPPVSHLHIAPIIKKQVEWDGAALDNSRCPLATVYVIIVHAGVILSWCYFPILQMSEMSQ